MAAQATLKIEHLFVDLDWVDHYKVIELPGELFYIHPEKGRVSLSLGDEIIELHLKSVRSEEGLPVQIEAYDILGEPMDEIFIPSQSEELQSFHDKGNVLMIVEEIFVSNHCILRMVDEAGEIVPISPADLSRSVDYTIETLLECDGIRSADFEMGHFVLEIDSRVSLEKISRDIEKWLGGIDGCMHGMNLVIITLEDYVKKFNHCPSYFLPFPNQPCLPGIRE